jgi:hypothetical protein
VGGKPEDRIGWVRHNCDNSTTRAGREPAEQRPDRLKVSKSGLYLLLAALLIAGSIHVATRGSRSGGDGSGPFDLAQIQDCGIRVSLIHAMAKRLIVALALHRLSAGQRRHPDGRL